jgi:DNA-binding NarL/FixJ family response regulator
MEMGIRKYLFKPVDIGELAKSIREVIDGER